MLDALRTQLRQLFSPAQTDGHPRDQLAVIRRRAAAVLVCACSRPELTVGEFVACAEALRRLATVTDGRASHAAMEAREALRIDPSRFRYPSDARVRRLVDALTACGTDDLARLEGDWQPVLDLHPTQIGRLFKTQTGTDFRTWRRVCRLKRAAHLLATTTEQVAQIAFAVGFRYTQQAQFSREFRALVGLTPSEFRDARTVE